MKRSIMLLVSSCLVAATFGGALASTTASTKKHAPTAKTSHFNKALLHPEKLHAKAPAEYTVKFETTAGDFTIKATRAWAPKGADRFYNLVKNNFYDGVAFFRVLPDFMAQFGMSPHPEVSSAWEQARIEDDPVLKSNERGFVSFAMAGPNTRTTQVFINFSNNESLDQSGFAPFGQVISGMDVLDKLYNAYGEGAPNGNGPDQSQIKSLGQAYLEQKFPALDKIHTAKIVR
jgi:peptidyl-prolyl cis-trans isomerase A (cyclophilin A)